LLRPLRSPVESEPPADGAPAPARGFVRGSGLLLVGRLMALGVNFLVQVVAVRYLAKSEFGAFSWALSMAAMGASLVLLGLNRGVAQLAPQHHERKELGALAGTVALALGTVAGLGLMVVVAVLALQGKLVEQVGDELSVGLLLILVCLTPLDALDALLETLVASLAGPRAVFLRRYALAPGLKLLAVLLVVALGGSVRLLAASYVVASFLGVALYVWILRRTLGRIGLGAGTRERMSASPRALFALSLPLLTTDLLLAVETPMVVLFLERFHGTLQVAELRAAAPVAGLCLLGLQNSKILFRPLAARLEARGDGHGLGQLYWSSAAWLSVITFPVFAVCVFLGGPLCLWMFGAEYAHAGELLAILAVGKYVNAALGMNTFTLQVQSRVRLVLWINGLSAVLGLGACAWLVPRFGAVGGAWATTAVIVLRNALYQAGLMATTSVGRVPRTVVRLYASVLAAVGALAALTAAGSGVAILSLAIAASALALLAWNRGLLDLAGTFPELACLPLLRRLPWIPASPRPAERGADAT